MLFIVPSNQPIHQWLRKTYVLCGPDIQTKDDIFNISKRSKQQNTYNVWWLPITPTEGFDTPTGFFVSIGLTYLAEQLPRDI